VSTESSPLKAYIFMDYDLTAAFFTGMPKGYAGSQQDFE
jgi:hypothetical protein